MASDSFTDKELRLVLIGNTGSGKSASANTILGEKCFESIPCGKSITTTCKAEHKSRFGRDIVIIDTPGAFDTERSHGEIPKEIIQCITMSAPGPHAFIMVLQAKRFTPEDQKPIQYFEDTFGNAFFNYLLLLFTGLDNLEADDVSLEEYLGDAPENLKQLLKQCGQRYVGFNNRETDEKKKEQMVFDLIDMIQKNVKTNHGKYFKSELLDKAEKEVQKREKEILKKKEKEIQKEREKAENEMMEQIEKSMKEAKEREQKKLNENEKAIQQQQEKSEIEFMERKEAKEHDIDDEQISVSELKKRFEQQSQSTAPPHTKPPKQVQPLQRVQPLKQVEPSPELHESQQVKLSKEIQPSEYVEPKNGSNLSMSGSVTNNELRLVLIGITGSGKGASANTILGEKLFLSVASVSSVTSTCKVEHKTRFGQDIVIVDTPGVSHTERSQGEITREIIQCITMSAPGPHAFIMVLQPKRCTKEEQNTIEYFEQVFGKALFDYLFLLFTHVDDLEEDGTNLEELLVQAPENLKKLVNACGRRYVGFNNREKDEKKKEEMVLHLINMIQKNVGENNGECYTSELLKVAEKEVQKREKEILKKKKKEIQKEREKIEREFNEEIEKSRKDAKEREEKILKEKEEKIRKLLQEQLTEKDREREMQRTKEKFGKEFLRGKEEMEKEQEIFEMKAKLRQMKIELETQRTFKEVEMMKKMSAMNVRIGQLNSETEALRKLEETLRAKEKEHRREARFDVRKEAETNKIFLRNVGNAIENTITKVGSPLKSFFLVANKTQ